METLLACVIGIGLSAACGFRVFVPMAGMSYGAMTGHLSLGEGFAWIGTWPALVAFSTATVFELAAYYIPWVDNLMDTITTPLAVVAGTIATASVVGDITPWMKWSLAIIAGGGAAGVVQAGTVAVRAGSTGTTGGLGNPIVATGEWILSALMTFLAIVLPILCLIIVIVICYKLIRKIMTRRKPIELPAS